jgi:hypothetical protein
MGRRKQLNILASISKEALAHDYSVEGIPLRVLGRKYNCSHPYIGQLLRKFGIPRRQRLIEQISADQLREMYLSRRMSEDDIARELRCSKSQICNLLTLHSIAKRELDEARRLALVKGKIVSTRLGQDGKATKVQHFLRTVNISFFNTWSPEVAYVLGVMATDGTLFQNKGTSGFSVSQKERELLDKILALMNSNAKILFKKQQGGFGGSRHFFTITNNQIFEDLVRLGLTPRKSLTLSFPDVPHQHLTHFIRGCWDGDGSVYVSRRGLSQAGASIGSGSKEFIEALKAHLIDLGLPDRPIQLRTMDRSKQRKHTFYSIRFSGRDAARLYKLLYTSVPESLYLSRKQAIFKAIADHFSSS